jgi:hypothetical protein
LRTTLHQMGVVKDAVERQARSSLGQLDAVMLQRRHREALARLGEVVWDLAQNGELGELVEHDEIAALLDELAGLEDRAQQSAEPGDGTVSAADWTPPASRGAAESRGPARGRGAAEPLGPGRKGQPEMRVWRPSVADIPDPPDVEDEPDRDAGRGRHAASPAAVSRRGPQGPNRSEVAGVPPDSEATDVSQAQERGRAGVRSGPSARSRGRRPRGRDDRAAGGIAFLEDGPGDEDDDLAGYMHEDDVPPRD